MIRKRNKGSLGNADHIGRLLRKLADLVERSTADEINALLRGKCELRIYEEDSGSRTVGLKRQHSGSNMKLRQVAEKLRAFETREAGKGLLDAEFPTKVSIEELARFLDLPVNRTDTIDSLNEKIVESQIGSRLRSEAVQGKKV